MKQATRHDEEGLCQTRLKLDEVHLRIDIINPRHMRRRDTVVVLCVCLSVRYQASCCIPCLQCGVIRFLMAFQTHELRGFL